MLRKGERTRRHIIASAARVFNERGFAGTSVADLLAASGLEKGGLYRHFRGKDELALAAFDHAVRLLRARHEAGQARAATHIERLLAYVDAVAGSVLDPPVPGGCPILNTAVDADDTHPKLRARAASALRDWQTRIARTVAQGVAAGELRGDLEPRSVATILTATLEGAIMLTVLLRDPEQMAAAAAHLRRWIGTLRAVKSKARA